MNSNPLKVVRLASILILGLTAPALYAQVAPGDTFDVAVVGFNSTSGIYVVSPIDATFGTTTVYHSAGLGGADVTVSSGETIVGAMTTDTITVSVPVNFLPAGTTSSGGVISELEFDLGGYDGTGSDALSLSQALDPATFSTKGSIQYIAGTFKPFAVGFTDSTDKRLSGTENIGTGTSGADESPFDVNSFTMSFSYMNPAPVPEPTSLVLTGFGGLALLAFRHRR